MAVRLLNVRMLTDEEQRRTGKKRVAVFQVGGKKKDVRFGQAGAEDYTTHGDANRRRLYRARHASTSRSDPTSPSSLSWWIGWGPFRRVSDNVAAYRKHYSV